MTAPTMTSSPVSQIDANVALVRRFYDEAVNRQNMAVLPEVVADDFVDHVPQPLPGQPTEGYQAIGWLINQLRTAVPDVEVTIEDVIAAGDKVVTRVTWSGTQHGPLLGAAPTGKKVRFTGIDIIRVTSGKMVEHWGQVDVLRVADQLGFMPV